MRRLLTAACAFAFAVGLLGATEARADQLDCSVTVGVCTGGTNTTTLSGATLYFFNGAWWTTGQPQATGSGVIDSFVRISDNATTVSGTNMSFRPLPDDENNSPTFTHDLGKVNTPIVTILGIDYYEFLLDINQNTGGNNEFLTLDNLHLCAGGAGANPEAGSCVDDNVNGAANGDDSATAATAALGYNFDTADANNADNDWVYLNYSLNSGSGSGDMFVYIPVSSVGAGTNLYLWSQFGADRAALNPPAGNNDGFEEWAVRTVNPISPVPEPTSMFLLGTGLAGLGTFARKRMNRKS
jgi:hypothetical protein